MTMISWKFRILQMVVFLLILAGTEGSFVDNLAHSVWERGLVDTLIRPLTEACYGDLGCFSKTGPFFDLKNRPVQVLPQTPKWIGTTFTLHTRNGPPQEISPDMNLASTAFSQKRQTKFIVHGFMSNSDGGWMQDMRKAFLTLDDFNVIIVDWRRGALPPYTQATANTRVVGAQIAQLIRQLEKQLGASAKYMHIIGHSLGAHICGYAGERTRALGRISGLDPADPYFQNTHPAVRLDPTDAEFVDVIHTDADHFIGSILAGTGGFGTKQPSGHVDFYPNGGFNQPGCSKADLIVKTLKNGVVGFIEGTKAHLGCDHVRVYDLYTASIARAASCRFAAIPCRSYEEFKMGKCRTCGEVGCGKMGYYADTAKPKLNGQQHVIYFLDTTAERPYCLHQYYITLMVNRDQRTVSGRLLVKLYDNDGTATDIMPIYNERVTYGSGREYRFVVGSAGGNVKNLSALDVQWQPVFGRDNLIVDAIVVDLVADDLVEHRSVFPLPAPLLLGQVLKVVKSR